MSYRVPIWRHFEQNDGAAGGAPAGQTAGTPIVGAPAMPPPAEPPAPPAAPAIDPAQHAALVLQNARLQARVAYPQSDVALLEQLTDVAQIDAVAKRTHELALQAQPQGGGQPAPVPADNATQAAEAAEQRRLRELQFKVRQRVRPHSRGGRTTLEPFEAEEAKDSFFRASWNAHMEHRRTGRGNVSAPPQGALPTAPAPALPLPGRAF